MEQIKKELSDEMMALILHEMSNVQNMYDQNKCAENVVKAFNRIINKTDKLDEALSELKKINAENIIYYINAKKCRRYKKIYTDYSNQYSMDFDDSTGFELPINYGNNTIDECSLCPDCRRKLKNWFKESI